VTADHSPEVSGSGQRFIGPEPCFGVSRQNIRKKMKSWMRNQHLALWRGPCSAQRPGSGVDLWPWSGHRGPTYLLTQWSRVLLEKL